VRRICQNCKKPLTQLKENNARYLKKYGADPSKLWQGAGCEKCRHTGYKGRVGVYELMVIDDDLRDLITRNPSLTEMRSAAVEGGMQTLRDDGLVKVANGMTTIEELMRVTEA